MRVDQLEEALRSVLERFGGDLTASCIGVESHIEFHPSRVYALAGSLAFSPTDNREDEVVVISVDLRASPVPAWELDVADRDSVVFADVEQPAPDVAGRMTSNPTPAAAMLAEFLETSRARIVELLSA